jgi:hypothetical protein
MVLDEAMDAEGNQLRAATKVFSGTESDIEWRRQPIRCILALGN